MLLKDQLLKFGLEEKEAKIYLALLELSEADIQTIAKKSGVKRTTVYHVLEALKQKGFIGSAGKSGQKMYFAQNPQKLEHDLEEKKGLLKNLMPELLSMTNKLNKKPVIKYFEGKAGLEEIFKDILNYPEREVLVWFPQKTAYETINSEFIDNFYTPGRLKKKILERIIIPKNPETKRKIEDSQKELSRIKVVAPEEYAVDAETLIYGGNKVGIISYEDQIGLIIESKKIHDMHKSIFELVWKSLPEQSR